MRVRWVRRSGVGLAARNSNRSPVRSSVGYPREPLPPSARPTSSLIHPRAAATARHRRVRLKLRPTHRGWYPSADGVSANTPTTQVVETRTRHDTPPSRPTHSEEYARSRCLMPPPSRSFRTFTTPRSKTNHGSDRLRETPPSPLHGSCRADALTALSRSESQLLTSDVGDRTVLPVSDEHSANYGPLRCRPGRP